MKMTLDEILEKRSRDIERNKADLYQYEGLLEQVKTAIAWLSAEEISRDEIKALLKEAIKDFPE